MKLSVLYPETRSVPNVVELAQRAEEAGFHGLFLGTAFGIDPIMALAIAGGSTERIQLGVAVVPSWPRHPVAMAQQAATASAACGGRFRLGVGPSHEPVMGMFGIDFDRPVSHIREYVQIVRALVNDGQVKHNGERYRTMAFLDVADAPPPPVMMSALQPQMSFTAGAHADGVLPWLAPVDHLADVIVPRVAAGAASEDRPAPPVLAEMPCALTTDRDEVAAMAATELAIYTQMPFYRALLERAGAPFDETGWSAAAIDAAIAWGDEDQLAAKIQGYFDAGADEVVLSPFGVGDDPVGSQAACERVLADINRT